MKQLSVAVTCGNAASDGVPTKSEVPEPQATKDPSQDAGPYSEALYSVSKHTDFAGTVVFNFKRAMGDPGYMLPRVSCKIEGQKWLRHS